MDSTKDTLQHIDTVRRYLDIMIEVLLDRKKNHDASKLKEPEKSIFDQYSDNYRDKTYGNDEYMKNLDNLKIALEHHYAENRHHPQHFENGIQGMNLIDVCEMIADWKASSLRNSNGNIYKSIEICQERFGFGDELKQIFINTALLYDEYDKKN